MTPLAEELRRIIYAASPGCGERQCRVSRTYDLLSMRFIFQHGDNPESALFVDAISYARNPADEVRGKFREFAERCHRYDDEGMMEALA